jgi:hypothetical protein
MLSREYRFNSFIANGSDDGIQHAIHRRDQRALLCDREDVRAIDIVQA